MWTVQLGVVRRGAPQPRSFARNPLTDKCLPCSFKVFVYALRPEGSEVFLSTAAYQLCRLTGVGSGGQVSDSLSRVFSQRSAWEMSEVA
jgi:hypothetical protein